MNIPEFIAKWRQVELTERSASQQHFLDLCSVFQHPTPAEADPVGEWFTFEKGAEKYGEGRGWADVWKRGYFGWEYKGKHKDLKTAYDQLLKYREALENPPLLVVCDMDRFQIHTNFTATASKTYEIDLENLDTPRNIEIIRSVLFDPEKLRPDATSEAITKEVAQRLAEVAQGLRNRRIPSLDVARFLDRIVFCLFAEDVGLLPRKLFNQIVEKARDPQHFSKLVGQLFDAMATGGDFGLETIPYFNGDLFTDSPVLELTVQEIRRVRAAAMLDWSAVDPSIFGTLFQRGLDPDTRAQLGAQYTSREDIETLIEPVVMQPLRAEWEDLKRQVDVFLERVERVLATKDRLPTLKARRRAYLDATREPRNRLRQFHERLCALRVLDPACGSGNFLYVTLQKLKDLEKEVLIYAGERVFETLIPQVGPWQFYGIEINPYAFELAQTTLWIGYLQWIQANGFGVPVEPILRKMDNFRNADAVIDLSDPNEPKEPEWPEADFIIGNPPFLGGKKIRREVGHNYFEQLTSLYSDRLPAFSDLCCYWFEKAREMVQHHQSKRVGLLATQAIRGGANREVLKRINDTGQIFFAESDRDWILDGATVHVSMIGFDDGTETSRCLDGEAVEQIHANLTPGADITAAYRLDENQSHSFIGIQKSGPFDFSIETAIQLLSVPNPTGLCNSDVIRPYLNALDLVRRPQEVWIIDFNDLALPAAAQYEAPFEYVVKQVKPMRDNIRRERHKNEWWLYGETRQGMRAATRDNSRILCTPLVAKHHVMCWIDSTAIASNLLIAIATEDDYWLGILQSRAHEVWARALGTQLREEESGSRYTPTTCFETFPFPTPTGDQRAAIATAASELDQLRRNWLNPSEWTQQTFLEFPGSIHGIWRRFVRDANAEGIGTVHYPRLRPKDGQCAEYLAKRTLTNLYNEPPTWLLLAHERLNAAVFQAFGWEGSFSDETILRRLMELNHDRARTD